MRTSDYFLCVPMRELWLDKNSVAAVGALGKSA
jgi:hypothetical protein